MFHFRGPSQVGDRLVLKAIVNNTFKNRWAYIICLPVIYKMYLDFNEYSCDEVIQLIGSISVFLVWR